MRIMDVQEFVTDQFDKYRERRTSQYIKFLDKSINFITYFHINKNISTTEIGNYNIDSYIGVDSPVRYNQINNFPIYSMAPFDARNDYDDDNVGFNGDSFSGELIVLPNTIEPSEGDCFIIDVFSEQRFFTVTEVTEVLLKAKTHYAITYTSAIPDYLPQLKNQTIEVYNAIFDNIGTHDKVIISNNEYTLRQSYLDIYNKIMEYYINAFFNHKIALFKTNVAMNKDYEDIVNYVDKFLIMFMEKNRIITLDSLTKNSLMLDYNALYDEDDYLQYINTIYWAIENKSINKLKESNYITIKKLISPFTVIKGQTKTPYYISDKMVADDPTGDMELNIKLSNSDIINQYNDYVEIDNPTTHDKIVSLIVKYLKDSIIMPGYFEDLYANMDAIEEYEYLPIILYIIRYQIKGLTTVSGDI